MSHLDRKIKNLKIFLSYSKHDDPGKTGKQFEEDQKQ